MDSSNSKPFPESEDVVSVVSDLIGEETKIKWQIKHFRSIYNIYYKTDDFEYNFDAGETIGCKCSWQLLLKVNHDMDNYSESKRQLGISCKQKWRFDHYTDPPVVFTAKIEKADKSYSKPMKSDTAFDPEIKHIIPLKDINDYLVGDSLIIHINFKVLTLSKAILAPIEESPIPLEQYKQLSEDLSSIQYGKSQEGYPTDFILESKDGKQFPCHKLILCARSKRFGQTFRLSRKKRNELRKEKFDYLSRDTLGIIVRYIYSGELSEDWCKLDIIDELTLAAGKFELEHLLKFLNHNIQFVCSKANAIKLLKVTKNIEGLSKATNCLINYIREDIIKRETPDQILAVLKDTLVHGGTTLSTLLDHKADFDREINAIIKDDPQKLKAGAAKTFSDMFPLLFQQSENKRNNLLSFLEPIASSFSVKSEFRDDVAAIFGKFGMSDIDKNCLQFVGYLIKTYESLREKTETLERIHIFAFMTDFKLQDTKVVIIFNTPSGGEKWCGYALHGAKVETTRKVIKYLEEEIRIMEDGCKMHKSRKKLPKLNARLGDCDLSGWISQGVLLMNSRLTYQHDNWDIFTNQLVNTISNECTGLVFILVGNVAWTKADHIAKERKHLILKLYHPTAKDQSRSELKWESRLPFTNANFHLHQMYEKNSNQIIDWSEIFSGATEEMERNEERKTGLNLQKKFFDKVLRKIEAHNMSSNEPSEEEDDETLGCENDQASEGKDDDTPFSIKLENVTFRVRKENGRYLLE